MELIAWIIAFIVAITIHEAAHAWMADRLGDPTPKLMGRLSLNPIVHYDPVGTSLLLMLVIMRSMGLPVLPFGWAKPVQFDPYNLKNPRRDSALISLAGPVSNFVVAIAAAIFARFLFPNENLLLFFVPLIILNISLGVFNLIPVHPLDGGKIFVGFLPEKDAHEADLFLRRYGMVLLLFLIFPTIGGSSPVSLIMAPIIEFVISILLPSSFV